MLYVYFGDNISEIRLKAFERVHTLANRCEVISPITADTYEEGILTELANNASLFGGEQVILLDTPSESTLFQNGIYTNIDTLIVSPHHFVMIEGGLTVVEKKKLAHATEMCEVAGKEEERLNVFALGEALSMRDRKTLWILYNTFSREGVPNEEIVGILFWQLKILRLAERTQSPEEAGQKPYPYQKAKRALAKFKKGELEALSQSLLVLYHEGHLGKCDMSLALERWMLSV